MHDLVVFGLIINIISRFIGTIVSSDMYYKTKDNRHSLQLIGWAFLLISGFVPFGIIFTQDLSIVDILRILNVIFLNIGLFLLITGLSMYFRRYPEHILITALLVIITAPLIVFLLFDVSIAINLSIFFQFLIIIIFLFQVYSNRREIEIMVQYSYGLILLLTIFLIGYVVVNIFIVPRVPDYSYGLYMSTDSTAIIAYYSSVAAVTLLGLMVFLHLEQGIYLKTQNILKDDYSHKIGNILQIIVGAGTTIKAFSNSDEVNESTDLILARTEEAGELIKRIREM